MAHTVKAGAHELSISTARLVRHAERMFGWSPERRSHAHDAAAKRLKGKHPRKHDAATVLSVSNG